MRMGASVVTYSVDGSNVEELYRRVQDHIVPSARQTNGYRGFLLIDLRDGQHQAIVLFDSVEDVGAAQQSLGPVGREHTYALMSGPATGTIGTVVVSDGVLVGSPTP